MDSNMLITYASKSLIKYDAKNDKTLWLKKFTGYFRCFVFFFVPIIIIASQAVEFGKEKG